MFRSRFLIWLLVGLGNAALAAGSIQAQTNRLFPSRGQRQPEITNAPPRRAPPPPRPDTVALPYNLIWGDTQNRLASLFAGVGAKITNKKDEDNLEVWTVQGLIAPNLQTSEFTFRDKQLAALEFDYGQPDWDLTKYNDVMGQFRRLLDAKCEKPGEMISRESDQTTAAGVKQSLMGYQWSRGDTLVQLFYFSAEDPVKSLAFRSISVHYHYQDPNPSPPPDTAELPTNPNTDPNASPLFGGRATPEPVAAVPTPVPVPGVSPARSTGLVANLAAVNPTPKPDEGFTANPLSIIAPEPAPAVSPVPGYPPDLTPGSDTGKHGRKATPKPTPRSGCAASAPSDEQNLSWFTGRLLFFSTNFLVRERWTGPRDLPHHYTRAHRARQQHDSAREIKLARLLPGAQVSRLSRR